MKFVRLVTCLLGSRSGFNSNFYCTKAMPLPRRRDTAPLEGLKTQLFRRISPAEDPKISMVPILDQWIEEGKSVDNQTLLHIMKKLLLFNRFRLALEISIWMDHNTFITSSDVAFRLISISKAKGLDEAEKYFNNLSQKLKCLPVYGALLNCYANAQCVEKAEAVMQQIKNFRGNHVHNYCHMLNLYRKTGNMEKFNALVLEMEENGIDRNNYMLGIQFRAYADAKDVEGMDKIVSMLESDPNVVPHRTTYSAAANGYSKAGRFDRALQMMKKADARLIGFEFGWHDLLLRKYGKIGWKNEVLTIWSFYTNKHNVNNNQYRWFLKALVKFGDIEMEEEIFNEWECRGFSYDMRIPNILIIAYSSRGLMAKAEALLNKAISKGGKPYVWTCYYMCEGYLMNQQCQKAVEVMKKITADSGSGRKPVRKVESIKACIEYLKGLTETFEN